MSNSLKISALVMMWMSAIVSSDQCFACLTSEQMRKQNALVKACAQGSYYLVKNLLAEGADASMPDSSGKLPILAAGRNGHSMVVVKLLKARADINALDAKGRSCLIYAARWHGAGVVRYLIGQGAELNVQYKSQTPLMFAAQSTVESGDKILALCFAGADRHVRNNGGKTVIDCVVPECKSIVQISRDQLVRVVYNGNPQARERLGTMIHTRVRYEPTFYDFKIVHKWGYDSLPQLGHIFQGDSAGCILAHIFEYLS